MVIKRIGIDLCLFPQDRKALQPFPVVRPLSVNRPQDARQRPILIRRLRSPGFQILLQTLCLIVPVIFRTLLRQILVLGRFFLFIFEPFPEAVIINRKLSAQLFFQIRIPFLPVKPRIQLFCSQYRNLPVKRFIPAFPKV